MLVTRINKIFRHDISAHLKACQVGIKFSSHLGSCESACRTQITSDKTSLTPQYVKNTFLDAPSLWIRENTPAIVAEIRPPLTAYERSLTVEKLAVGASALAKHSPFPTPQRPLPSAIRQLDIPTVFINSLFGRPSSYAHSQQRKKPDFIDVFNQFRTTMQKFLSHLMMYLLCTGRRKSSLNNNCSSHSQRARYTKKLKRKHKNNRKTTVPKACPMISTNHLRMPFLFSKFY